MAAYFFLLGFLPFVHFCRYDPIPSFWTQWITFLLATLFVIHILWLKRQVRDGMARISGLSVCLLVVVLLLLAQVYVNLVGSKINALFAMVILTLGASLHQSVKYGLTGHAKDRMMGWWAKGTCMALICQILASVLLVYGKAWVPFHLVDVLVPERIFGTFGQPNQFGVFVVLALASLIYLVRKGMLWWPIFVLGWVLAAILCAASGSRAALMVWMLLCVINGCQEWRRRINFPQLPRIAYGKGLLFLHACFGAFQIAWSLGWIGAFGKGGEAAVSGVLRADPISARFEQYRDSFHLFIDRPLFGYGFEQFAASRIYHLSTSLSEPQATHTHNLLTNSLVEYGFIGGIVVVLAVFWVVSAAWKAVHDHHANTDVGMLASIWALGLLGYAFLEYPMQYVNFLYPFLLAAAFLPGFDVAIDRSKILTTKLAMWGLVSFALLTSSYVAWDYLRLQTMIMDMEKQAENTGRVDHPPSLAYLTRLRQQSVFVRYVDFYWMKELGISGDIAEEKIQVAKELFERVPSGDALSWYAVHLISGKRNSEALALMCNFGVRNIREFDIAMAQMNEFANFYPPAAAFLAANHGRLSKRCK